MNKEDLLAFGSLYLLVKFDKYFQVDRELVYEIY